MKRFAPIIFLTVVVFTGCDPRIGCSDQYITPAFIGFNLSDLDTIVVRQYKKGDNFLTLIDTSILTFDTNYLRYATVNDTTFVLLNHISGQEKYIFPDHDWQIYIPAGNTTIPISDIISPQTETTCFNCNCWNPINSFTQNAQTFIPESRKLPNMGGEFYMAYIHR